MPDSSRPLAQYTEYDLSNRQPTTRQCTEPTDEGEIDIGKVTRQVIQTARLAGMTLHHGRINTGASGGLGRTKTS